MVEVKRKVETPKKKPTPKKKAVKKKVPKKIEEPISIVDPHGVSSREVVEADFPRVLSHAQQMLDLCKKPRGKCNGALALAHSQVEKEDPLRFFVTADGFVCVNPVITNHTRHKVHRKEQCLSFPDHDPIRVARYNKVTVKFAVLFENELIYSEENIHGRAAKVFQHEIDHMNALYIHEHVGRGFAEPSNGDTT